MQTLTTDRCTVETGHLIRVQVPKSEVEDLLSHLWTVEPMSYGDYDCVSFQTSVGEQQFRALGTGRNSATADVVAVRCVELSFFVTGDLNAVVEAIYEAHPYEEPVIYVETVARCLHIRGRDEKNPNRFWNRETPDWVPDEHRD